MAASNAPDLATGFCFQSPFDLPMCVYEWVEERVDAPRNSDASSGETIHFPHCESITTKSSLRLAYVHANRVQVTPTSVCSQRVDTCQKES